MCQRVVVVRKIQLHRDLMTQFNKLFQDSGLDKKIKITYPDPSTSQGTSSMFTIKIEPFQQDVLSKKQKETLLSLLQVPKVQIDQRKWMDQIFSDLKELRKKYKITFERNMTMDSDKIIIHSLRTDTLIKVANTLSTKFSNLKTLSSKIIKNDQPFLKNKENIEFQQEEKQYVQKLSYDLGVYILENQKELDIEFKKRNIQLVQCEKEGEQEQWFKIEWMYKLDDPEEMKKSTGSLKGYNSYSITELRMFKDKFYEFQKSKLRKFTFKYYSEMMKAEYQYTFTKGGKFSQKNLESNKVRAVVMKRTKCIENPLEIKWLFESGYNWSVCNGEQQKLLQSQYQKIINSSGSKKIKLKCSFGGNKYEIELNLNEDIYFQTNIQTGVTKKLMRNLVPKSKQVCYYQKEREFQNLKLRGTCESDVTQFIKFLQKMAQKDILQEVKINLSSSTAKEYSISFPLAKKFQMEYGGVTVEQRNGQFYLKGPFCHKHKIQFIKYLENLYQQQQKVQLFSNYPKEWTNISSQKFMEPKFIQLSKTDPKFIQIETQFKKTCSSNQVIKIERMQNKRLWQRYQSSFNIQKNSALCTDQKYLFHGTSGTAPINIASSEQGLDLRYSNNGLWGRGIYFAVNSSYSASSYSYFDAKTNYKSLFYVRVMIGDPVPNAKTNSALNYPPLNPNKGPNVHYDSVQGTTGGSIVYIIYSNDRCYPEYLITFK